MSLDSSVLIAWIKGEPLAERLRPLFTLIDQGEIQLIESVIVLAEVFKRSTASIEEERSTQDAKLELILNKLQSPEVFLADVTPAIARKVADLRAEHGLKLPDATHLATAVLNKCDWFVTLDADFPELDKPQVLCLTPSNSSTPLPWEDSSEEALIPREGFPTNVSFLRLPTQDEDRP
ncbi:MAG: PIN domain-containing protein [Propionibacteriaceae bacterium]|nr:PIN domain-containing protein [Propionibacteriaceae bacterium]